MYSTAKRRLANPSLAEDITQIVFIRFAKNPPKVKSPGELAAWLHRTTVHVTVDLWRSESRRRAREMEAVIMEPVMPEAAIWEEISPKLDEALNQLDEDDRQALLLRFFSEKSMREVGAMLGVSEDAAKMRVSRALERLRTQMRVTATACTAAVLGTLLAEHSVEAVPASLISRLSALKLPAAAGVAGSLTAMIQQMSKFKLAAGVTAAALLTLVSLHIIHSANKSVIDTSAGITQTNLVVDQTANGGPAGLHPVHSALDSRGPSQVSTPPEVAMLFHVAESETGQPLGNAQIHFAYFSAGGNAEGRSLMTDSNGTATILEPKGTTEDCNLNVFVVAEGHVPEAIQFHTMPADYSIKLDPAMTVSGMVENEQGRPVSGVEIMVQNPGIKPGESVSVDFQTCPVTNREDGTWSCSYIPSDYTNEVRFILRKKGYATTYPVVPVDRTGWSNLVLIINRGYTISGRVMGAQASPVANASIKVLTDEPGKNQSAKTDDDGFFKLEGVAGDPLAYTQEPSLETNESGEFVIRGLAGDGPRQVNLAVQAEGFAPQTATVALSSQTNEVDFTLLLGNIFRGHVVDESGHAIPNAIVQTDWNNQGIRVLEWQAKTDVNGGFEWDFAPTGSILFWFDANGYQPQRGVSLAADGSDHQITLKSDSAQ